MPTFSYKGYDFDVDHTPTEAEFTQMSAYVDSLPAKEPSFLDKALGVGEAALNTATGFTTGTVAGAVGGLQEFVNKAQEGRLPKPSEVENAYMEQADLATYSPRTKTGQKYTDEVGKVIQDYLPALIPIMPELAARGVARGIHDNTLKGVGTKPQVSPEAAKIKEQRKAAQENAQKATKPEMPQEPIVGAQGDLFRDSPEEIVRKQREQAAAESEGIQRDALGNQGDLFVGEGKPIENPLQRGFQEDQAWNQRNAEVEATQKADTDLIKQREEVAQEPLTLEPEQASSGVDKMSNDRTTNRPSPNRGKFGQGGAIDPDVFLKDFPDFIESTIKDAAGKLKVLYHGTSADKIFDNFKANKRGIFLTDDPKVASEYAKDNDSKSLKYDPDKRKYVDVNMADRVMPVYANIKKPYTLTADEQAAMRWTSNYAKMQREFKERLQKQGYDGILYPDGAIVAFEPSQIVSATSPKMGQSKFGKGQRGSIGFFGKDPFEKFQEDIKRQIPDATPEEIKKVWEEKQASDKQVGVAKAVGKINPKLADNLSIYNDVDKPSALAAVASSPDSPTSTLGFMRNQVLSRGRLGLEKIKNEGVKSGLAYMIGLHDKGGIAANQVLHGPEGILRELRKQEKLFTEGNAGEVLRQRQEAQLNPEYKYNLSPAQMKINEKISKVFEDIRQQMEQITGKKIAQIPNYFPSMFYGPFAVELRDASGKLVAFVTENSAKAAAKEAALVKQELGEGFTVSEPRFRKEVANNGFKNKAGLAPYFEAMLDLLSSDDPAVLKAQESVQRVVAKRAMDTQQMQNRLKYKAGVIGEEGRKLGKDSTENYRDAKDVLENYVRGFEEWKANMESAKFINEVKEAHGATNTYNILQDYFDNLRGNREGSSKIFNDLSKSLAQSGYDLSGASKETARKTAGLVTKGWLGFWNPAAMAQNILQPLNTFPKLVELATNGGSKDIVSPFLIGMAQSLKDGFDLATHKTLGKDLSERMKYIRENEVIKPGLVEAENRTKVGHYLEKGLVSGGLLSTEAFARGTTFNIFEQYLKSSGYDATQARTLAKNLTHDYQVNYENYAKSGAIANSGFVGELAGRLQSYKINQMTQLANYILELKQSKNPAPLAAFLALSIGMAGVSGMIGMDVAEGIYGLLVKAGLVEPDVRSPRQMALDLGGASATGIPSAVTGKWLSGSLSTNLIGDMSWRNIAPIFAGIFDTGSKLPIAGRWAKDVVTGEHTTPLSEKAQLLQAVTPATIRGRLEDKLLTDSEGRVTSPYTGKVTYVNGEQDKDLLSRFTNLRSEQRGESVARSALLKNQEKNITDAINSRVTRLEKLVDESVRMNRPLSDDVMSNELQRILDLGGDPQQTIKKINDFVVTNHLGDWFEQQLAHGKINLGTINKKMRAMNEREKLYGQ